MVSNPVTPTQVGSYSGCNYDGFWGVAVLGDYAYGVCAWSGLHIINISEPAHSFETSHFDTTGLRADDIEVAGIYAYVADGGTNGLRIINVADPYHPAQVAFYRTFALPYKVVVNGNYIYMADGVGGLLILRTLQDKVTGAIPPEGGSLSSTDGDTAFVFSEGAFTQTVTLVYRHLLIDPNVSPLVSIGHTFEVTAVYSDTNQPAQLAPGQTYTITVHYTDAEKGPAVEETLALYYWDGRWWVREPTSRVNAGANIITAQSDRLGTWAVLGETWRVYLPLTMRARR